MELTITVIFVLFLVLIGLGVMALNNVAAAIHRHRESMEDKLRNIDDALDIIDDTIRDK